MTTETSDEICPTCQKGDCKTFNLLKPIFGACPYGASTSVIIDVVKATSTSWWKPWKQQVRLRWFDEEVLTGQYDSASKQLKYFFVTKEGDTGIKDVPYASRRRLSKRINLIRRQDQKDIRYHGVALLYHKNLFE